MIVIDLEQVPTYFFVKYQRVNILGFAGYVIFVTTTQLCLYSVKAVINICKWKTIVF